MNHIHTSAMTAIATFLMLIPIFALWRLVAMHLSQTSIGKAMAFVF